MKAQMTLKGQASSVCYGRSAVCYGRSAVCYGRSAVCYGSSNQLRPTPQASFAAEDLSLAFQA